MTTTTNILDELAWRGLLADSTDRDELRKALDAGPVTLYCGFDPSGPSLHVGHLTQTLTLRRFQLAGHRPLALVGGATGLIGDPKMAGERTLNDASVVDEWSGRIRSQLQRLLDFGGGPTGALLVNNYDWTSSLSTIEFLRDVGKHFSVNRMLDREAVSARLAGSGISYTEFSYVLLQSYDFLQLFREYGCTLQIGGSDQWGNITAGVELVRRSEAASVHALTTPLLTKSDGSKFGKTEGGTIWLDPALTSPYAFYQYWINVEDEHTDALLKTFTFLDRPSIEALAQATAERPAAREAQRALAAELTSLVHGVEETERVEAASKALFGHGALEDLAEATLGAALREAPHVVVSVGAMPSIAELFSTTGLVASKSAARRTAAEGGLSVNNVRVTDADAVPSQADLIHGRWLVLRRGRRQFAGVDVTS
ncbi:MAG: tyrosine--tRNA ligase [Actinomycetes bacterium]